MRLGPTLAFSCLVTTLSAAGEQAHAQRPTAPAARPYRLAASAPRLIVVVTVDQMRADYLERFKGQFTGGLARLLRAGAVFTEAFQDHAMSETAVGHATILAGRNPNSHGVISNAEGVPDPNAPLIGARGPGASPLRFRGTTLVDWLLAVSPTSRVLSVSRKDRGAILPVGRSPQAVFWYASGVFTTSDYYADSLPSWVQVFNARAVPAHSTGRAWELLLPADSYPEPDDAPWENGGVDLGFPHRMPEDSATAIRAFIGTPWMDELTLDFALEGVRQTGIGRGPGPDILAVSLSSTDAIGHTWGPYSREMHDECLRVDRMLGTFLDSLGRLRDPRRTLVVLTSDHGITPMMGWARGNGFPLAASVSLDTILAAFRDSLALRAGPGRWVRFAEGGLIALDRPGLAQRGVDVDSAVLALTAVLHGVHGVLRVDTPGSVAAADTATDAIARRWRNAVPPDIGAELMVTLGPKFAFGNPSYAEHGQPSDDDTHVPIVFMGPGIQPGMYANRVSVVDIAPTLALLLGVRPTEPILGRALTEALASGRR